MASSSVYTSSSGSDCPDAVYKSHFKSNFDTISRLGKGGFGHVFEVKNKLDGRKYAVKRVVLPNKKELRDGAMREVKALSTCNHENIVSYIQSWIEDPVCDDEENRQYGNHSGDESDSFVVFEEEENTANNKQQTVKKDSKIEWMETNSDVTSSGSSSGSSRSIRPYLFIQMELCRNNLKDWILKHKLSCSPENLPRRAHIFEEILKGVEYFHGIGIIHRDLKVKRTNWMFICDCFLIIYPSSRATF